MMIVLLIIAVIWLLLMGVIFTSGLTGRVIGLPEGDPACNHIHDGPMITAGRYGQLLGFQCSKCGHVGFTRKNNPCIACKVFTLRERNFCPYRNYCTLGDTTVDIIRKALRWLGRRAILANEPTPDGLLWSNWEAREEYRASKIAFENPAALTIALPEDEVTLTEAQLRERVDELQVEVFELQCALSRKEEELRVAAHQCASCGTFIESKEE